MSSIHVAFVRAVMIGREGLHRPVLLDMFERAGGSEATSYISTGNVSFPADPESIGELVELVEADLEQLLGAPHPAVRPARSPSCRNCSTTIRSDGSRSTRCLPGSSRSSARRCRRRSTCRSRPRTATGRCSPPDHASCSA
ncbi:MAG: DUF1697 domain-containing protein [Ilumatobacteraceae bacterium]